jgi:Fe-S-cluster-containing dehydrogenase component
LKNYGMVIDVAKCTGCYNCVLACKDEHCGESFPGYTEAQPMTGQFWINLTEVERGTYPKVKLNHIPITCRQCEDAPCLKAAENGAIYRREDGVIMIDPVKAAGQKQLVNACPYRVIFWNEEKNVAQKCTMCAHLLDDGYTKPRCVEMCPTGALAFGDLNDPASEVAKLNAEQKPYSLHPEFELTEKVLYLNVPKTFIAGTVVFKDSDRCVENATVTLKGEGVERSSTTDVFGDFWFEGLDKNTNYVVEIAQAGYKKIHMDLHTYSDVNMGEIFLEREA